MVALKYGALTDLIGNLMKNEQTGFKDAELLRSQCKSYLGANGNGIFYISPVFNDPIKLFIKRVRGIDQINKSGIKLADSCLKI